MMESARKELNKQLRRLVALTSMASVSLISVFASASFSRRVTVYDQDCHFWVVTMNSDTYKILEQINISLDGDDLVYRVDNDDNSTEIVIKRAFDVVVTCGNEVVCLRLAAGTVEDAINASGFELNDTDRVSPDLHMELRPDMEITIERSKGISITADGVTKKYAVPPGKVADAMKYLGIPLSETDVVNVDLDTEISDDMQISIERVTSAERVVTKDIPYKTIKKDVGYLEEGTTEVSVKGVSGKSETIIKDTIQNGEVVNSEDVKTTVIAEPIDEIVLVGTKKKEELPKPESSEQKVRKVSAPAGGAHGIIVDQNGNALSYSRKLKGSGTAYTAAASAKTSLGKSPKRGTVAVNPSVIPYGTRMYIVSDDGYVYGNCVASDTGGAPRSGRVLVDLYMNTTQECFKFGRRNVSVYILD